MYTETKRMIIRDFLPEDVADLHEIIGDSETMKNCEPAYDMKKTNDFLTSFCIGRHGAVAAVHRDSGKVIGYILFNEQNEGIYEMGWFFNRGFWRQGYAYESCNAVIEYAFGKLNARKIFAETIDTAKSVNLMKKLRMKPESVQRGQATDSQGNTADLYFYSLLKDERNET